MWVAGAVMAALAVIVTARSVRVVPANTAFVVERLGRYWVTLRAGVHVLMPFVDRIAFRFPLQPKDSEISTAAISLDNVPLSVAARVRWQIADPQRAAYAVANLDEYIAGVVQSAQREWIGARNENDVRANTREQEVDVAGAVEAAMERAGLRVEDVSVLRIERAR